MPEIQDVLIGAFVISMMLSVGADLTWRQLRAITQRPAMLVGGLVAGYLVVPASAYLLGNLSGMSAASLAGLLLCAAAPGGPIGALFTQRAGGDLALSVSLLMLVNFINLFATPITLQLLGATPGGAIVWELLGMFGTILCFQVTPLVIGVQLREIRPHWAERVGRYGKTVANLLLLGAIIGIGLTQQGALLTIDLNIIVTIQAVTLIAMAGGWLCVPGDRYTRTAGALSNTVRSQSLAILLASTRFPSPETLLVVLCFSVLMFTNGIIASSLFKRMLDRTPPPAQPRPDNTP